MTNKGLVLCGVLLAIGTPHVQSQPNQELSGALARSATYVTHYISEMSTLIGEERYEQVLSVPGIQQVTPGRGPALNMPTLRPIRKRLMTSDVLLLKVPTPIGWRTFRDVFEVEGASVRDHSDRLSRLFSGPRDVAISQAEQMASESARYNINIGSVGLHWMLNEPGLPMMFLQQELQGRFAFSVEKKDGSTWIVRFTETARPALFTTIDNQRDNPTQGRFWIDPRTGEVSKCELTVEPLDLSATFTTEFKQDGRVGAIVPVVLREHSVGGSLDSRQILDGTARYSKYRRFEIRTEERIR